MRSLRPFLQRLYHAWQKPRLQEIPTHELQQSAIVFAPHPDDETLGCGGTIIRKLQAGAEVQVVFMTDGSDSHKQWMSPKQLRLLRQKEAQAACTTLGLSPESIHWLDFKDGQLQDSQAAAVQQVRSILRQATPEAVFVPSRHEAPPDHYWTRQIVRQALKQNQQTATVYEYPVWFWCHWPWTGISGHWRSRLKALKHSLRAGLGWRLVQEFRVVVPVDSVLAIKQTALAQHQTQMQRQAPDWPILADVDRGQWLACFFQNYEFFHRYHL